MPPKNTVKNISATIKWESQFGTKDGQKQSKKSEILDARVFPEELEPGYVNYGRGETIKIGEFESTKVYISVSMPCLKEELVYAMKFVTAVVEKELDNEIERIEEKYGLNQ